MALAAWASFHFHYLRKGTGTDLAGHVYLLRRRLGHIENNDELRRNRKDFGQLNAVTFMHSGRREEEEVRRHECAVSR